MFRSAKAVRITRTLLNCQDKELKYLKEEFQKEIHVNSDSAVLLRKRKCNRNELVAAFLADKHHISNESMSRLIAFINTKINIDINNTQLEKLPQDVFSTIGSYLLLESSINFSLANSTIYTMVQNDEYFSQCREQTKTFTFTPKLGRIIIETNANMECYKKCKRLYLIAPFESKYIDHRHRTVKCSRVYGYCALMRMASAMQSDKKHENTYNYDLEWFPLMLSNVKEIYWSTRWICAFTEYHIPMSWIFDIKNNNYNDNHDGIRSGNNININYNYKNVNGVKIGGCTMQPGEERAVRRMLTIQQNNIFLNTYDQYFLKKMATIQGDQNKIDTGDVDRDNSILRLKFMAETDVQKKKLTTLVNESTRRLKDMKIDVNRLSNDVLSKLHGNYGELTFSIPPKGYWKPLDSLEKFYQVFHRHLTGLHIRCQLVENNDLNIVSQLFDAIGHHNRHDDAIEELEANVTNINKHTLQLINDLNKSEKELSFKKLLDKHLAFKLDSKTAPQIKNLKIIMDMEYSYGFATFDRHRTQIDSKGIVSFFKHERLMKLFNFSKSVIQLEFDVIVTDCTSKMKCLLSDIMKVIELSRKRLKRLKRIQIYLRPELECKWQQFCLLYDLYIDEILLNCCLLPKIQTLNIIGKCAKHGQRIQKINQWNIVLDSIDMLLAKNSDILKKTVQNQSKKSRNVLEAQWSECETDIKSGDCLVKHSFHFTKTFRV